MTAKEVEIFPRVNAIGDTARVRFTTNRGRVTTFTVQYEPWIEGRFRPVVRFDNAHGRVHRDILGWNAETVRKDDEWEGALLDPGAAMSLAITEIRRDWAAYKNEFVRRKR